MATSDAFWLTLVFSPIAPFLWHPERIAVVAVLFWLGYRRALRSSSRYRAWPLLVAAIAWGLWVPWEWYAKAVGANIRIDLFLIGPLLLAVTGWSLIACRWLKSWK